MSSNLIAFTGAGGYDFEREEAAKVFVVGQQYKLVGGRRGDWSTSIQVEGVEGSWNSCLFDVDIFHPLIDGGDCRYNRP